MDMHGLMVSVVPTSLHDALLWLRYTFCPENLSFESVHNDIETQIDDALTITDTNVLAENRTNASTFMFHKKGQLTRIQTPLLKICQ